MSFVIFTGIIFQSLCQADEIFSSESTLKGLISNTLASGINKNHKNIYDDLSLSGIYNWTSIIDTSISLGIVKSFTQEAKTFLKDTVLAIKDHNLYTEPKTEIRLAGNMKVSLPTSKASQNRGEILALNPELGVSKNYLSWMFEYELSGSTFFNQYITARDGTSNTQYGITHTAIVAYQFTDQLSATTVWSLLNFATYNNTAKSTYAFTQECDYALSSKASLSAGLSTGGRQYKNNGKELNIALLDVEGSEIFMGVNYEF